MNAFTGNVVAPAVRAPMFFEWPASVYRAITERGVHVVYILGFEGEVVKVGHTVDFLTRLSANRSSPRRRGRKLVCGWRTHTDDPMADEARLKAIAADLGALRVGRSNEWFTGVDVRELIAAGEAALCPRMERVA